jgi:hypothetical protein
MSKQQIRFKNPDFQIPEYLGIDEDKISAFYKEYSEYGDYWCFEIDTETLEGRLIPRIDWE